MSCFSAMANMPCPLAASVRWIEWGIGGGVSQTGDQPAKTALEAAHTPYFGGLAWLTGCQPVLFLRHPHYCKVGKAVLRKSTTSRAAPACLPSPPAPLPARRAGVQSPYNASRDPWRNPAVRDYMRYYINQTSAYLLQAGWRGYCRGQRRAGGDAGRVGVQQAPMSAEHTPPKGTSPGLAPEHCWPSIELQGGCEYHVGAVYLWTVGGSWDVIGM